MSKRTSRTIARSVLLGETLARFSFGFRGCFGRLLRRPWRIAGRFRRFFFFWWTLHGFHESQPNMREALLQESLFLFRKVAFRLHFQHFKLVDEDVRRFNVG